MNSEFLLKAYGEPYDPEVGPWTLSAANKYLEFRKTEFFEDHFQVKPEDMVLNVGIGTGSWDRYLSYQLREGSLTSVDGDGLACIQLIQCLQNEGNPAEVRVLHRKLMEVRGLEERFDLVTLVGHTGEEDGTAAQCIQKAAGLVRPGGSLYFQTLDLQADPEEIRAAGADCGLREEAFISEQKYRIPAQYWKFSK